jgi:hypothetical protein
MLIGLVGIGLRNLPATGSRILPAIDGRELDDVILLVGRAQIPGERCRCVGSSASPGKYRMQREDGPL